MSVFKVTDRYELLGLQCVNVANHWGADNNQVAVLNCWEDHTRTESNGERSVILVGNNWDSNPIGYNERIRHIEMLESGVPCFVFLSHNCSKDPNKAKVDITIPPDCYQLTGATLKEGGEIRGILGNHYANIHALRDVVLKNSPLAQQTVRQFDEIEQLAPVRRSEVPLVSETEWHLEAKRRKTDPDRPAKVYVFSVDEPGIPERLKIGFSQDPEVRLSNIEKSSPFRLALYTHSPFHMPGRAAYSWEQEIHRRLAEYRLHGEWFAPEALQDATDMVKYAMPLSLEEATA